MIHIELDTSVNIEQISAPAQKTLVSPSQAASATLTNPTQTVNPAQAKELLEQMAGGKGRPNLRVVIPPKSGDVSNI